MLLVVVVGIQALGGGGGDEADSAGGDAVQSREQSAAPDGPGPVTLKLTESGVRQAGAISAGSGAGLEAGGEEEGASDTAPESAVPAEDAQDSGDDLLKSTTTPWASSGRARASSPR